MRGELMDWGECEREFIRRVDIDEDKINSILKMCKVRIRVLKQIKLDEETASVIADDYYEVIKELLTALLLLNSLKSSNHECLISFFKKIYPDNEYETKVMYELKRIRNKINYEGFFVEKSYVERSKLEFGHIIRFLKKEIKEKLKSK
jgi:uncharacterized protein (UPF0332 family)